MSSVREGPAGTIYQQVQASDEFREFRGRIRRYVFPMTVIFLTWYLAYVLLASYAPVFMSTRVVGTITVGLLIGLGQFVSTFLITTLYVRFAARSIDPDAERLRARVERAHG
ncbi:DUF485 domain-containing protein [Pseudonocardia endophytica]|uniref:Uncharacterized membrane protein (DUF485 family) n=1 Tax=Pseudonocardia endophytica TaxID=401976 RepID=A0A4R1IAQ1_PSEEN|nr:DUF485 domain-containing protein [Pseudonocardia endophytica]TCK27432.1 uncharacterized membrane protein (DUF485 family) [Pseudonocardia endophytica]